VFAGKIDYQEYMEKLEARDSENKEEEEEVEVEIDEEPIDWKKLAREL